MQVPHEWRISEVTNLPRQDAEAEAVSSKTGRFRLHVQDARRADQTGKKADRRGSGEVIEVSTRLCLHAAVPFEILNPLRRPIDLFLKKAQADDQPNFWPHRTLLPFHYLRLLTVKQFPPQPIVFTYRILICVSIASPQRKWLCAMSIFASGLCHWIGHGNFSVDFSSDVVSSTFLSTPPSILATLAVGNGCNHLVRLVLRIMGGCFYPRQSLCLLENWQAV